MNPAQSVSFIVFFVFLPSEAVDKESNGEGAKNASNREDGDRDGPDGCEVALGDGSLITVKPRLIDKVLNDLPQKKITFI